MEKFLYRAYDQSGVRREGEIPALNLASARSRLKQLGLIPTHIEIAGQTSQSRGLRLPSRSPGLEEIEFITTKLSLLLRNGIKIDRALENTRRSITHPGLKKIIGKISDEVRQGTPLSEALKPYPEIFDPLYVSLVKIGEATGKLGEVFAELSQGLKFRRHINARTRQALVYPILIFCVCIGSVVFIFDFIVPRFAGIFSEFATIPVYTQILLTSSEFFRRWQAVLLLAPPLILFLLLRLRRRPLVRQALDQIFLRLPLVRTLCLTLENLRFASTMAILLRSRVVLTEALDYAVKAIGNRILQRRLTPVRNEVRQGARFSQAMADCGFFPETFDGLLEVGEETGNLDEIFTEIEQRLREDYENQIAGLLTLIEPAMIIFMGLMVGSIVLVMLLSMVSINNISF